MSGRNIFSGIIVTLLIFLGAYWYFTKPSAQENAVYGFFNEVRRGNPGEADDFLVDSSFGKFISDSKITDSDGTDLKEGLYGWGDDIEKLEQLAWDNIPLVKGRVPKFEMESASTQRIKSEKDKSFVQFKIIFTVKEALDQPGIPGYCSGNAELKRIGGKWLLKGGEYTVHIQGRSMKQYAYDY
jgi:hypothetical protein